MIDEEQLKAQLGAFDQIDKWFKAACQVGIGDGYVGMVIHDGQLLWAIVDSARDVNGVPFSLNTEIVSKEIVEFIKKRFGAELQQRPNEMIQ